MLQVVYSYWDGSGHRKSIELRKGTTVGRFLELVKAQLAAEFHEMRSTNPEDLVYVKEDLIIPHVSFFRLNLLFPVAASTALQYWPGLTFHAYASLPLQHYSFYDLIVTKARGKSGPLFHFDVHDDVR